MDFKVLLVLTIFSCIEYQVESKDMRDALRDEYEDKFELIRSEFELVRKSILGSTRNMNVRRNLKEFNSMINFVQSDLGRSAKSSTSCLLDKVTTACKKLVGAITLTALGEGLYYFHTDQSTGKTWYQSSDFCRKHGMELVSIETEAENLLIKAEMQKLLAGQADYQSFFWTGLNDFDNDKDYYWAGTGEKAAYFDWLTDNQSPSGEGEHCAEIWQYVGQVGNVHWNDRGCKDWKGRFICELLEPCSLLV